LRLGNKTASGQVCTAIDRASTGGYAEQILDEEITQMTIQNGEKDRRQSLESGYRAKLAELSALDQAPFLLDSMVSNLMFVAAMIGGDKSITASCITHNMSFVCASLCVELLNEFGLSERLATVNKYMTIWSHLGDLMRKVEKPNSPDRLAHSSVYLMAAATYIIQCHVCKESVNAALLPPDQVAWLRNLRSPLLSENQSDDQLAASTIDGLTNEMKQWE
jgi:hypothetical protein